MLDLLYINIKLFYDVAQYRIYEIYSAFKGEISVVYFEVCLVVKI